MATTAIVRGWADATGGNSITQPASYSAKPLHAKANHRDKNGTYISCLLDLGAPLRSRMRKPQKFPGQPKKVAEAIPDHRCTACEKSLRNRVSWHQRRRQRRAKEHGCHEPTQRCFWQGRLNHCDQLVSGIRHNNNRIPVYSSRQSRSQLALIPRIHLTMVVNNAY